MAEWSKAIVLKTIKLVYNFMGSNPISPLLAEMAEWSKAADCKFALVTTHWFESSSPHIICIFKMFSLRVEDFVFCSRKV